MYTIGSGLVAKLCPTPWTAVCHVPVSMGFSRQEYWRGLRFLLQVIFPTQELNLGPLHWRQILYWLSHKVIAAFQLCKECILTFFFLSQA